MRSPVMAFAIICGILSGNTERAAAFPSDRRPSFGEVSYPERTHVTASDQIINTASMPFSADEGISGIYDHPQVLRSGSLRGLLNVFSLGKDGGYANYGIASIGEDGKAMTVNNVMSNFWYLRALEAKKGIGVEVNGGRVTIISKRHVNVTSNAGGVSAHVANRFYRDINPRAIGQMGGVSATLCRCGGIFSPSGRIASGNQRQSSDNGLPLRIVSLFLRSLRGDGITAKLFIRAIYAACSWFGVGRWLDQK